MLKNAAELKEFSKGEEDLLENQLLAIKEMGVNVVVSGKFNLQQIILPKFVAECTWHTWLKVNST